MNSSHVDVPFGWVGLKRGMGNEEMGNENEEMKMRK